MQSAPQITDEMVARGAKALLDSGYVDESFQILGVDALHAVARQILASALLGGLPCKSSSALSALPKNLPHA